MVRVSEVHFEVWVGETAAMGGGAHKRLLEILAEHFKLPRSRISIRGGAKARNKTVQVILEHTADLTSLG